MYPTIPVFIHIPEYKMLPDTPLFITVYSSVRCHKSYQNFQQWTWTFVLNMKYSDNLTIKINWFRRQVLTIVITRDRPIIGFTDLSNRYQYRLIGIDSHHIGKIGIGIVLIFIVENRYRQGLKLENWLKSVSVRIG